jgi:hypothetical protein
MLSHDDQLLISAYIDGEVSPAEKLRAEQLLVDDAAARAFREELLSMSAGLKSLPRHTLPSDFSDDVLAAAERAMFTAQPWPGDAEAAAPSPLTRIYNARTIAYAGATFAAAILVCLFIPQDGVKVGANENVAKTPANYDNKNAPPAMTSDPVDAEMAAPEKNQPTGGSRDGEIADKDKKDSLKPTIGKVAEESQSPDDAIPAGAPRADALPEAGEKLAGGGGRGAGDAPLDAFGGEGFGAAPLDFAKGSGRSRKNTEPALMVVSLDVGESALSDGTLQRVLAAHRVESKDREAGYALSNQAGRDLAKKTVKKADKQLLSAGPSTQTFYAEMSRSQLNQVLAQLKTDPKVFSSVALYGGKSALSRRAMSAASAPGFKAEAEN